MEDYIVRFASIDDHERLVQFYRSYYKAGHPLYDLSFWKWQYGNEETGRSIIAEKKDSEIIGHIGCNFGGGMVWLINILINREYSGHGLTTAFFDLARTLGPIAVAVANAAGQALLAKKQWYRHADLQRLVLVNPAIANRPIQEWVQSINLSSTAIQKPEGNYWQQPGLNGMMMNDGSTAVVQQDAGGLRVVDLVDADALAAQAWELGFSWVDYIASWNHPMVTGLLKKGWKVGSALPWYLNPVDFNMQIVLNVFSEEPLDKNFLFHRSYADLGRVGRISDV